MLISEGYLKNHLTTAMFVCTHEFIFYAKSKYFSGNLTFEDKNKNKNKKMKMKNLTCCLYARPAWKELNMILRAH